CGQHEVYGFVEGLRSVVIETEDKASHQGNPPCAYLADHFLIVLPHVEAFFRFGQRRLVQRLKPISNPRQPLRAARSRSSSSHAMVVVTRPPHWMRRGISAAKSSLAYGTSAIRLRSRK